MNLENNLKSRAQNQCELCGNPELLQVFEVSHAPNAGADAAILVCGTCASQLEAPDTMDPNHWRCLNDSMWSPVPAVQVIAWRTLNHLKGEGWPQDLLDMMYLEEETLAWAKAAVQGTGNAVVHRDVNGNILQAGDNVVLIKDLKVKGSSMVAKQGTAVRRISLDHDNAEYIEGKVDGQQIVILTKYVKKT